MGTCMEHGLSFPPGEPCPRCPNERPDDHTTADCPKCVHYGKNDGRCHLPDFPEEDGEECIDDCVCYEEPGGA